MRARLHAIAFCGGTIPILLASTAQAAINISTLPTQNMSCSGGVCTATAQKAYLNVNDVTAMLAAGDLKVVSGAGAQDIHIQVPFSWTSLSRLTLDAQRSIEFEKPVTVAGTGALTLITNDGGTGGDYWFDEGASVSFWDTGSSLIINGQSFTLVKDIKTLASDIKKAPKGDYALANSYDASADGMYNHAPILTVFGGIFEGLGNAISNMYIRKDAIAKDLNVGLFGGLGPGGIIRDITLFDAGVDVAASNANVGTLLGYSNGGYVLYAVANGGHAGSSAFINVSGGLIGSIDPSSLLWKCSSSSVSAGRIAGSLVGLSQGAIEYSSASGNASSTYAAGSLVGMSEGSIDGSYASGNAGAALLAVSLGKVMAT